MSLNFTLTSPRWELDNKAIYIQTADTYKWETVLYDLTKFDSLDIDASGAFSDVHIVFSPECHAEYEDGKFYSGFYEIALAGWGQVKSAGRNHPRSTLLYEITHTEQFWLDNREWLNVKVEDGRITVSNRQTGTVWFDFNEGKKF